MRPLTGGPLAGRVAGVFVQNRTTGFATWAERALRGGCGFGLFGANNSTGVWMIGTPTGQRGQGRAIWSRLVPRNGGAAWSK